MRTQTFIASLGGAAGWFTVAHLTGAAQILAALATAVWMSAQTWVLLRRQRCTEKGCPSRRN